MHLFLFIYSVSLVCASVLYQNETIWLNKDLYIKGVKVKSTLEHQIKQRDFLDQLLKNATVALDECEDIWSEINQTLTNHDWMLNEYEDRLDSLECVPMKWENINTEDVAERMRHSAVVYDDYLWVYGGYEGVGHLLNDMWKYSTLDGWTLVNDIDIIENPGHLYGHTSLVYQDSMFVFGGWNETHYFGDFWKFSFGTESWEKLLSTNQGRDFHSMVLYKDYIYVYAGYHLVNLNDLWRFSIADSSWLKEEGVNLMYLRGHSSVVYQNSMWIFGGNNGDSVVNNLYKYSFGDKSNVEINTVTKPTDRYRHSAVVYRNSMWIFGGYNSLQNRNDLWKFSFVHQIWKEIIAEPKPTERHSTPLFVFQDSIGLFGGGASTMVKADLWLIGC